MTSKVQTDIKQTAHFKGVAQELQTCQKKLSMAEVGVPGGGGGGGGGGEVQEKRRVDESIRLRNCLIF